ncbi:hypothetical protein BH11CYA1_BH11CYA1_13360 [soil metagenome]
MLKEGKHVSLATFRSLREAVYDFLKNEEAQGITEYGAVLCFVSLLIALAFTFTNGSLGSAVITAFSCITSQLNNMSQFAASSS